MKKPLVVHPFLMALFPIASLYSHNMDLTSLSQTLFPSAIVLCFTGLSLLLLVAVLGDARQAGLIVSASVALFFSYGHALAALRPIVERLPGDNAGQGYLLAAWAALFALYVRMATRTDHLDKWTSILNVVGVAAIAISVIRGGTHGLRAMRTRRSVGAELGDGRVSSPIEQYAQDLPDIYCIILDRYASADTLEKHFQFDNSEFIDYLARRGFFVASEARANYPKTFLSLASSLNMKHLTYLTDELGKETSDETPVYGMLEDYKVWRFLKSRGYRFLHFGSWWEPTRQNKYADVNLALFPREFSWMLYRTTMLYHIGVRLDILDPYRMQQRLVLRKFDELAQVPGVEGPKFVFAHMLLPHGPFLFGPNGEMLTQEEVRARSAKENYLNQLVFTNREVRRLIDRILSSSDRPPIIILQSDEGPHGGLKAFAESTDWSGLSDQTLRAHMRIFSAYHLPGADAEDILYPSVTPVNSFRVIFDHYFGTDYGLLPDKSYMIEDLKHPYSFIDVTEVVDYD